MSENVPNEREMNDEEPQGSGDDAASALSQCEAEKAELQDRVLRTHAEFQNFRRRVEKERLELSEYASMEAVRSLIPVLDDFERAVQAQNSGDDYAKGMELIHQRFTAALQKLGLEPIVSQGQAFDPNMHHAVEMVETGDAPDQTILAEFQRGYNFKGRLLRAAMVKVAVQPKTAESK
ncbi:MAG: nucleotide exchange factor GrpE [Acidobacteriota bacterium]